MEIGVVAGSPGLSLNWRLFNATKCLTTFDVEYQVHYRRNHALHLTSYRAPSNEPAMEFQHADFDPAAY